MLIALLAACSTPRDGSDDPAMDDASKESDSSSLARRGRRPACPSEVDADTVFYCGVDDGCFFGGYGHSMGLGALHASGDRKAFSIDMSDWSVLELRFDVEADARDWLIDVGDSPSDNGWGGDGGDTRYDAEVQLLDDQFAVYRNDVGGNTAELVSDAVDPDGDSVILTICDGFVRWESSTSLFHMRDPDFLRKDTTLADDESPSGTNDAIWHVGLNRTVADSGRTGSGVSNVELQLRR